jgi:hypothetical protein
VLRDANGARAGTPLSPLVVAARGEVTARLGVGCGLASVAGQPIVQLIQATDGPDDRDLIRAAGHIQLDTVWLPIADGPQPVP